MLDLGWHPRASPIYSIYTVITYLEKKNKNKNKNNANNRNIVEGVYLRRLDYFVHVSSHDQALTPPLPSATQRLLIVVRALGVWSLNLVWLGGNLKRKCLVFPSKYKRVFL